MLMKKYMDIERIQNRNSIAFTSGENIVVTEKIDGANCSIAYENGEIKAFSRKNELNYQNNLRGFWNLTQSFDVEAIKELTEDGRYILFGEWLCKHTISYPDNCYNKMYMFDTYDTVNECWMPHDFTYTKYNRAVELGINIEFVPIIFKGQFSTWEALNSYVGTTQLNASPCGEGIVVKSQDRLDDKANRLPIYLKIVAEKFSEVHSVRPKKTLNPEALAAMEAERELVSSIVTERRTRKLLEKLVDENIIPEDWDEKTLGLIAKNINKMMYEDCIKEEKETVEKCANFGKISSNITMSHVRNILTNRI